jgi:hypothetical protein
MDKKKTENNNIQLKAFIKSNYEKSEKAQEHSKGKNLKIL